MLQVIFGLQISHTFVAVTVFIRQVEFHAVAQKNLVTTGRSAADCAGGIVVAIAEIEIFLFCSQRYDYRIVPAVADTGLQKFLVANPGVYFCGGKCKIAFY